MKVPKSPKRCDEGCGKIMQRQGKFCNRCRQKNPSYKEYEKKYGKKYRERRRKLKND